MCHNNNFTCIHTFYTFKLNRKNIHRNDLLKEVKNVFILNVYIELLLVLYFSSSVCVAPVYREYT